MSDSTVKESSVYKSLQTQYSILIMEQSQVTTPPYSLLHSLLLINRSLTALLLSLSADRRAMARYDGYCLPKTGHIAQLEEITTQLNSTLIHLSIA